MKLKRTHVGKYLSLDCVEEGQWRILSDEEVRKALDWEPRILEANQSTSGKKKQNGERLTKTTRARRSNRRR